MTKKLSEVNNYILAQRLGFTIANLVRPYSNEITIDGIGKDEVTLRYTYHTFPDSIVGYSDLKTVPINKFLECLNTIT